MPVESIRWFTPTSKPTCPCSLRVEPYHEWADRRDDEPPEDGA